MSVKIYYSPEDIEDYLEYEDPEAVMLAARKADGLPPPIRLAEPWEPAPPILIDSRGNVTPWQPPASAAWLAARAYPESTANWLAARGYPAPAGVGLEKSSPAPSPAEPGRSQGHGR